MAVLTVGDERTLYFKKRVAVKGSRGKKKWKVTDDSHVSFSLENNSVFLLHPEDEKPVERKDDKYVSQYVHGGVNIQNDNDLSIAFVFRVVSVEREYDAISSKLIPTENDLKEGDNICSERNILLRKYLDTFRSEQLDSYCVNFKNFVNSKFIDWKWF